MAQLKSTIVKGNLTATGQIVADIIIKNGGTDEQLLCADGSLVSIDSITGVTTVDVYVEYAAVDNTAEPDEGTLWFEDEEPALEATQNLWQRICVKLSNDAILKSEPTTSDLINSLRREIESIKELAASSNIEITDLRARYE